MPLERLHPQAFKASEATHCAEDQGKFSEMQARLFANQKAIEPLSGHAEAIGLDVASFDECMSSGKYTESVKRDMTEAAKAGASGTPSFVVALTDPDDPTKVKGITFIRGAQPFARFKADLDSALAAVADSD